MLISGQQLTDKLAEDENLVNREFMNMQNVKDIQRDWRATFASLVPLWLLSFSIMVEGFPKPLIPIGLAFALLVFSILTSIVLEELDMVIVTDADRLYGNFGGDAWEKERRSSTWWASSSTPYRVNEVPAC